MKWHVNQPQQNFGLKAGWIFFQCRFNEQVFPPKSWKKIGEDPSCCFQEKCKYRRTPTLNSEKM